MSRKDKKASRAKKRARIRREARMRSLPRTAKAALARLQTLRQAEAEALARVKVAQHEHDIVLGLQQAVDAGVRLSTRLAETDLSGVGEQLQRWLRGTDDRYAHDIRYRVADLQRRLSKAAVEHETACVAVDREKRHFMRVAGDYADVLETS